MISEKQFSEQFSGFWNQCLPFLTPYVIAQMNVNGTPMPDSRGFVVKPLDTTEDFTNNDLVADTGFGIFTAAIQTGKPVHSIRDAALLKRVKESAFERIKRLRRFEGKTKIKRLRRIDDSVEIAVRLEDFFENEGAREIVIQPRFKGCGILDSCYGDLFSGNTLYEVKCVERNLRSIDIRQILAYCTLNYQSRQFDVDHVCIVNPRRGISFRFGVESLAQQASGKNSAELFHQIGDFLMNFETIQRPS
jgi:hypothetical protein